MGLAIARSTSGGTGVGPGANKYRFNIDDSSSEWVVLGKSASGRGVRYHCRLKCVKARHNAKRRDCYRLVVDRPGLSCEPNCSGGGDKHSRCDTNVGPLSACDSLTTAVLL